MRFNRSLFYKLLSLFIVLIGLSASVYVGLSIKHSNENSLVERVNTLSKVILGDDIVLLNGNEFDLENTSYQKIKDLLVSIRSVNHDVRFIYINGIKDGKIFFFVDSEEISSHDYSPPGELYEEATPFMYKVFDDGKNYLDISRDRWGYWFSAYAPILNRENKPIALIGIDIPANSYIANILVNASLPLLIMFVFLIIIYFTKRSDDKERIYLDKRSKFLSMVTHDIRNPLTGIKWSSESMSKDVSINDKNKQALVDINKVTTGMIDKINNFKF